MGGGGVSEHNTQEIKYVYYILKRRGPLLGLTCLNCTKPTANDNHATLKHVPVCTDG